MYLHMGNDVVIPLSEVISVIDLTAEPSQLNQEFISTAEEEGFVVQLSDKPVSIVICATRVYLSQISAKTLYRRASCSEFGIRD